MRIGTNVAALTTHRILARSDGATARSLERMSTGARINSAADDAGGLTVSEGLRSRSSGLRQAARNVRDGIELVRTAEGALAETTSLLQRMRDLAVQAANDGALDASAKDTIQREIGQLSGELTRIATTTTYDGIRLLDGSYRGTFQVGAEVGETITLTVGGIGGGMDAAGLGVDGIDVRKAAGARVVGGAMASTFGAVGVVVTPADDDGKGKGAAGSLSLTGDFGTAASFTGLTGTISYNKATLNLASVDYTGATTVTQHRTRFEDAVRSAFGLKSNQVTAGSNELVITGERPSNGASATELQDLTPTYTAGPTPPVTPPTTPPVTPPTTPPTTPTPLGPPSTPVVVADDPLSTIDRAIQRISTTRAGLGAVENRLEHTIARLGVASENATAAYSRIRDADMAMEMTGLTRNQVLVHAGSAMLAQANQRSQGVLRLLT